MAEKMTNDSKNKSTRSKRRRIRKKNQKSQVKTKKTKTLTTENKTQEANNTAGRKTEKVRSKLRRAIILRKKAKSTTKQQQKHNNHKEISFRFDDVQVALRSILDETKNLKPDKQKNQKLVVVLQNCFNKCLQRNSQFVQILQEEQPRFDFSTALEILTLAVLRRLTLRNDGIFLQDKYISGFDKHEHVHTLCQLQEKCKLHRISLCFCFVELERRDTPTNIQPLLDSLVRNEEDKKFAILLKHIYTYLLYSHTDEVQKEWLIKRVASIYHNSQLSLLLDRKSTGFDLDGNNLTHLLFGKHIVLVAEFPEQLIEMIVAVKEFNPNTKTSQMKIMLGKFCKKVDFFLNGVKIPVVKKYTCHGKMLSASGSHLPDMSRRIEDTWNVFNEDEELISQGQTRKETKSVFKKKIIPILLEGTELSSVTKPEIKELKKVLSEMEEEVLGCATDHGLINLENEILRLKLSWAGHVMRREETRWCRRVTIWPTSPDVMIGWRKELVQLLGSKWSRLCSNRSLWKEECEKVLRNSTQSFTPNVRDHKRLKTLKSNSLVPQSQSRVIKTKPSSSTSYRSSHQSSFDYYYHDPYPYSNEYDYDQYYNLAETPKKYPPPKKSSYSWSIMLGISVLLYYYLRSQFTLSSFSTTLSNVLSKLSEFTFSKRFVSGLVSVMFLRYLFR